MRFPRMTTRRWMVLVAVGELALWWLVVRPQEFRRRAEHHQMRVLETAREQYEAGGSYTITPIGEWHWRMAGKYQWAATHPWLPVPKDPPEPK
jgi:hypothetical protein